MNEVAFFANLSQRLGRTMPSDAPQRDVVGAPQFWRTAAPFFDKVAKFSTELDLLGGQVIVCESLDAFRHQIGVRLAELSPAKVGVWGGDFVSSYDLNETLNPYSAVIWGPRGVSEFEEVDVSITGCAYAVADTGSIVLFNQGFHGRSVPVLPAMHMVIIHEEQILSRMGDVLSDIADLRETLPASVHFISGPSRSSDIENDQTIGIHGPAAVMAFVIRAGK